MNIIKAKKCSCGNIITASAEVTGYNQSLTRIDGGVNRDINDRVLCECGKVHNFHAVFENWIKANQPNRRLAYLRGEILAERISYGEIAELQSLSAYIPKDDTLLREWAGIPEFDSESSQADWTAEDILKREG
jgi:hypothetical protein